MSNISSIELPGSNVPIKDVGHSIFYEFQAFCFSNNLIAPASGLAIGLATKEVIEKVLNLVVLPLLVGLVHLFSLHKVQAYALQYVSKTVLTSIVDTAGAVFWSIFMWILTLFLTFFVLEFILNRKIIGLKSTIKDADQKNFVKAKLGASDGLIPTQEQVHVLHVEQEKEKKLVKEIRKEEAGGAPPPPKQPIPSPIAGTFDGQFHPNGLEHFHYL